MTRRLESILNRVVALTGLRDAYVAMVALRGRPTVPGSRRPADCEPHLVAYALPWIDVITPRCRNAAPISGFARSPACPMPASIPP